MAGKRTAKKPKAEPKAGWDREQFSVRLTDARRERLRLISAALPEGSTPIEAVDLAVEIALSKAGPARDAGVDLASRLDDLEEMFARHAREREAEAAGQRSVAAETLREARSISALMAAVATMPDMEGSDDGGGADAADRAASNADPAPWLRTWLDARAGSAASIACTARWRSKSRLGERLVAMEFDAEVQGQPGSRSVVRIEPLDAASPLALADQAGLVSLVCRRIQGGGWEIGARRVNADRSAGSELGRLRV